MSSTTARTTMPIPENGTVSLRQVGSTASATCDLGSSELRRGLGRRSSGSRPVSPALNGLHRSRAVLLADRLHGSPLQVMAHRIFPGACHEVARAARVSPKRSRQRFWFSPGPQQSQECVPDPNPQRQKRIAHLVRQDSWGLGQERPQGRRMRHVPLPCGHWPLWRARSAGRGCRLFCLLCS
jgi:hypothetical protein